MRSEPPCYEVVQLSHTTDNFKRYICHLLPPRALAPRTRHSAPVDHIRGPRALGGGGGGNQGRHRTAGAFRAAAVPALLLLSAAAAAASALILAPSLGEAHAQTFSPPPTLLVPTLAFPDVSARDTTSMRGVLGVDSFTLLNGDTHVIAAVPGGNDASGNGIRRIRVLENAEFDTIGNTPRGDSVFDGDRGFTALGNAAYVEAFTLRNGSTFAMVATLGETSDRGVQLVRVLENGTLVAAGTAINGTQDAAGRTYDRLASLTDIDVFTLGNGERYAMVTSSTYNSVQLVRIHENSTMSAPDSATDFNSLSTSKP